MWKHAIRGNARYSVFEREGWRNRDAIPTRFTDEDLSSLFTSHLLAANMSRVQRLVLILYCLLIVYCCVWVPWHLAQGPDRVRVGYGWLWAGPSNTPIDSTLTTPNLPVIALRLLASTALAGAFVLARGN